MYQILNKITADIKELEITSRSRSGFSHLELPLLKINVGVV